jgi:hypothetical protein
MMARLLFGALTQDTAVEANPDPPRSVCLPISGQVGPSVEFDLLAIETKLDGEKVAVYVKHESEAGL